MLHLSHAELGGKVRFLIRDYAPASRLCEDLVFVWTIMPRECGNRLLNTFVRMNPTFAPPGAC